MINDQKKYLSTKYCKKILFNTAVAACSIYSVAALALEEIIVTATHVETNLVDTPLSVSNLSGDELRDQGLTNLSQIADSIPNVSMEKNIGNALQVTIRGITSNDGTEKGDPSASVMIDGVYIARPQDQIVNFFDVERVEVLRGPQGTLWGRNTTAGVIHLITSKPNAEREGALNFNFGNYSTSNADFMYNLPVNDKFMVRVAGAVNNQDTFMEDLGSQVQTYGTGQSQKDVALRVSGLWNMTDNASLLLRLDTATMKGMAGYERTSLRAGNYDESTTNGKPFRRASGSSDKDMLTRGWVLPIDPDQDNSTWGANINFDYKGDTLDYTYIGSYRESRRREGFVTILAGGLGGFFEGDFWQTSHEFRIVTNGDGPLTAQAGVYYFKEESDIIVGLNNFVAPVFAVGQDPTISESKAVFGQLTYDLSDSLSFTAGIRYSQDDKERTGGTALALSKNSANPTDALLWLSNSAKDDWAKTTWRLGLDYHLNEDTMIYGSVATGYKAGGFGDGCEAGSVDRNGIACNQVVSSEDLYYDPEELTAYEIGLKSEFWESKARLSSAIFYYDYTDMQLTGLGSVGGLPAAVTKNAGKSEVSGLEVELELTPIENHYINLGLTLLDTQYKEYLAGGLVDFSGKDLDRSPEMTASIAYTYSQHLDNGASIDYSLNTRYSDSYLVTTLASQFEQDSFTKTNASIIFHAPGNSWYVKAYIKNIEDEIQLSNVDGFGGMIVTDPRTWGVGAGLRF